MNDFEGLVLRKTDINEADAMLCVLTEQGKKSFKVKGVNKLHSKNAYGCQLFTQSFFHLLDKGKSLKNVEVIQSYKEIREDLVKQSAACLLMEAADRSELFSYQEMIECLNALKNNDSIAVVSFFMAQLLNRSGIGLQVDQCVICDETKGITAISLQDGGFICQKCFDEFKHVECNLDQLKYLRRLFKANWTNLNYMMESKISDFKILEILLYCFEKYGDFPLKGSAFYLKVIHMFKFDKSL